MKWNAHFKGGRVLEQFDERKKERLFREVLDKQEDLETFDLVEDGKVYSVDLKNGEFCINGQYLFAITEEELGHPVRDIKYRIIYYRRMRQILTETGTGLVPSKTKAHCYLLGWQATIDDKNIQRILHIYPDGKIFLRTK